VINIVDLMRLQPPSEHPHGMSDRDFDALFTTDKPIIFAFHGFRGSSTGSPTGAAATTTSMRAATRRRARPALPV
jgi:phosphoketolase